MRIIFIRHGDPDYEKDSLTEKGWREAALLAERVARWKVTDFYVSPLGAGYRFPEPEKSGTKGADTVLAAGIPRARKRPRPGRERDSLGFLSKLLDKGGGDV